MLGFRRMYVVQAQYLVLPVQVYRAVANSSGMHDIAENQDCGYFHAKAIDSGVIA